VENARRLELVDAYSARKVAGSAGRAAILCSSLLPLSDLRKLRKVLGPASQAKVLLRGFSVVSFGGQVARENNEPSRSRQKDDPDRPTGPGGPPTRTKLDQSPYVVEGALFERRTLRLGRVT